MRFISSMPWVTCGQGKGVPAKRIYFPRGNKSFLTKHNYGFYLFDKSWYLPAKHVNINVYFDNMLSQIYPLELQLNKANTCDTEAAFLDLHLSISNDIVPTKIYDKRDDFDFEVVNFLSLDGDVPRSTCYGVYISQLIRFV